MAFVVSDLPDFKELNKEQLINKVVLGGNFIAKMTKQTGIKKDALLNYLDTAPAFGDGSACGFSASGDTTFTQRTINTGRIKVNMSWCPQTLVGKYTEYKVRLAANPNAEALPFEEEIIENVISHINAKMESAVFWGDTSKSTDTDRKWFDGLIAISLDDSAVVDVNISAGASAYEAIKAVYMAIPEEVLGKAEIYVAPALYRQFIQELVDRNYYHYSAGEGDKGEFILPGTNTKVVAVKGLTAPSGENTSYIIAADPAELVYGCDLENAQEDARVWFSDDDDLFKVKFLWNAGVNYYFGDHIVLGAYSTITSPASTSASIAGIAASVAAVADSVEDIAEDSGKIAGTVNADNQIDVLDHSA